MNRRKFLTLAGVTTGYSVLVRVPPEAGAQTIPRSQDEISQAFDTVAPPVASGEKAAVELTPPFTGDAVLHLRKSAD